LFVKIGRFVGLKQYKKKAVIENRSSILLWRSSGSGKRREHSGCEFQFGSDFLENLLS